MSRLCVVFLALFPLLFSAGCAKSEPIAELRNVLGLEIGRQLEYAGEGNEYAAFTSVVTHSNDNLYQLEEDNGGTVVARVIELRRDGAYEILARGEHYTRESILTSQDVTRRDRKRDRKLLPWPLREGAAWSLPDGSKATLVAVKEERSVPAGTFDEVVHVRTVASDSPSEGGPTMTGESTTTTMDFFYAPEVGLIERRFTQGDFAVTSRLSQTAARK